MYVYLNGWRCAWERIYLRITQETEFQQSTLPWHHNQ